MNHKRRNCLLLAAGLVLSLATLVFIGISIFSGEKDPYLQIGLLCCTLSLLSLAIRNQKN